MIKKVHKHSDIIKSPRSIKITRKSAGLAVLVLLVPLLPLGYLFGLFSFEYNYLRCRYSPIEVDGQYYRLPIDHGYGLHLNSYFVCYGEIPEGVKRDPIIKGPAETAALKKIEAARIASISYTVYKPENYEITSYGQSDEGDRLDTRFIITTDSGTEYDVQQMKKGSSYDYTQQCSKPSTEHWSGTVIGVDAQAREICRINLSKYVTQYTVGIYAGNTAIVMRTESTHEKLLDAEITNIFSSMKPSS